MTDNTVFTGTLARDETIIYFEVYPQYAITRRFESQVELEMLRLTVDEARGLWQTFRQWGYEQTDNGHADR